MFKTILAKKTRLTQREYDIVVFITIKMSHQEIRKKLGISGSTLRRHLIKIMNKLQCFSKSDIVVLARSEGWVRSTVPYSGEIKHTVMHYDQVQGMRLFKFSS